MIDIHTHILPMVDDGSQSIEESLILLRSLCEQGVKTVFVTPHLRNQFNKTPLELKERFDKFVLEVKNAGIDVELYLGQEIYLEHNYKKLFKEGTFVSLNNSKYVLVELNYSGHHDVAEIIYDLTTLGYKPIVAHVERYRYLSLDDIIEIKQVGGLLQVNADSIAGKLKKSHLKRVKKLFKYNLVDFVASDVHVGRSIDIKNAYTYVAKKYGTEVADRVFKLNAQQIING